MNETIKNILTRRSIRKFTDKPISKEDLTLICDCARFAPSGMNRQSWKFTVIQNKEKIAEFAKAIREALNRDEGYNFYAPDALILVSNEKDSPHAVADSACALENIFLAAHSLGIGSVWINQFKDTNDNPQVRSLLNSVNLPATHNVFGAAALGYAEVTPEKNDQKEDVVEWII